MIKIDENLGQKLDYLRIKYGDELIEKYLNEKNHYILASVNNYSEKDFLFISMFTSEKLKELFVQKYDYKDREEFLKETLLNVLKNIDDYHVKTSNHGGYKRYRINAANELVNLLESTSLISFKKHFKDIIFLNEGMETNNKMRKRGKNQIVWFVEKKLENIV